MKTAKDYQQEFRLKDDELAQFDEFLNNPKHTCFHGKEYLIYKDPDPEGSFIIVGVNFRNRDDKRVYGFHRIHE